MDGKDDAPSHSNGPQLFHFRDSNLKDVTERQANCWKYILASDIPPPASSISVYLADGEL